MHFERSIDIAAPAERVWEMVADIERWPERIETVDEVERLTPPPTGVGSRFRLKQPKLPEAEWEVTAWQAPTWFEWRQQSGGVTNIAGHRIEPLDGARSRLTLTIDLTGLFAPIGGLMYRGLINRYMGIEAEGMKRAAESR